jgi:thiol-disulfide isomerase/thioredoxin
MIRAVLAWAVVSVACSRLAAEPKIGDPAPPLKVSKWIRGKPITLAGGNDKAIYVVDFWATWRGACRKSIPNLTKLAHHFEKAGVIFLGVSVDDAKTKDEVEPFVKSMGKKMDYAVALDEDGLTSKAYLGAGGLDDIPHSFIIGKDGRIAWHGHPMDKLDQRLAELAGDKVYLELLRRIEDQEEKLGDALENDRWDDALAAADKLLLLDPETIRIFLLKYEILATKKKDKKAAASWGGEVVEKSGDVDVLDVLSWNIMTEPTYEGSRDLKLALAAAKKANELCEGKDWAILETYARALFETGERGQAIELQEKAILLAKEDKAEKEDLDDLSEALKEYREKPADAASKGRVEEE